MITESDLEKYRAIYKEKFGQDISPEAAQEQAAKLLQLQRIVIDYIEKTLNGKQYD